LEGERIKNGEKKKSFCFATIALQMSCIVVAVRAFTMKELIFNVK
jgi:hypothetical protein